MMLVISIVIGSAQIEPSHAIGLSALVVGILEALFSPITLFVILVAFGAAFWLVRRSA